MNDGESKVKFTSSSIGKNVRQEIDSMEKGDVLPLENLRFYKEGESNGTEFSKELASFVDIDM